MDPHAKPGFPAPTDSAVSTGSPSAESYPAYLPSASTLSFPQSWPQRESFQLPQVTSLAMPKAPLYYGQTNSAFLPTRSFSPSTSLASPSLPSVPRLTTLSAGLRQLSTAPQMTWNSSTFLHSFDTTTRLRMDEIEGFESWSIGGSSSSNTGLVRPRAVHKGMDDIFRPYLDPLHGYGSSMAQKSFGNPSSATSVIVEQKSGKGTARSHEESDGTTEPFKPGTCDVLAGDDGASASTVNSERKRPPSARRKAKLEGCVTLTSVPTDVLGRGFVDTAAKKGQRRRGIPGQEADRADDGEPISEGSTLEDGLKKKKSYVKTPNKPPPPPPSLAPGYALRNKLPSGVRFVDGERVEASDTTNTWYKAKLISVREDVGQVYVHFEGWNSRYDEWIPMHSRRIRPLTEEKFSEHQDQYKIGDYVIARWKAQESKAGIVIETQSDPEKYVILYYDHNKRLLTNKALRRMSPVLREKYALQLQQLAAITSSYRKDSADPDGAYHRHQTNLHFANNPIASAIQASSSETYHQAAATPYAHSYSTVIQNTSAAISLLSSSTSGAEMVESVYVKPKRQSKKPSKFDDAIVDTGAKKRKKKADAVKAGNHVQVSAPASSEASGSGTTETTTVAAPGSTGDRTAVVVQAQPVTVHPSAPVVATKPVSVHPSPPLVPPKPGVVTPAPPVVAPKVVPAHPPALVASESPASLHPPVSLAATKPSSAQISAAIPHAKPVSILVSVPIPVAQTLPVLGVAPPSEVVAPRESVRAPTEHCLPVAAVSPTKPSVDVKPALTSLLQTSLQNSVSSLSLQASATPTASPSPIKTESTAERYPYQSLICAVPVPDDSAPVTSVLQAMLKKDDNQKPRAYPAVDSEFVPVIQPFQSLRSTPGSPAVKRRKGNGPDSPNSKGKRGRPKTSPPHKTIAPKELIIQLDHNEFKCAFPDCAKSFRKQNLLRDHMRHYHKIKDDEVGTVSSTPRRGRADSTSTVAASVPTSPAKGSGPNKASSISQVFSHEFDPYLFPGPLPEVPLDDPIFTAGSGVIPDWPTEIREMPLLDPSLYMHGYDGEKRFVKREKGHKGEDTASMETEDVDHKKRRGGRKGSSESEDVLQYIQHDHELVHCVCQYEMENGFMIQCELCATWQHGACYGIDSISDVPKHYVCDFCQAPKKVRFSQRKICHDLQQMRSGKLPVYVPLPEDDPIIYSAGLPGGNLTSPNRGLYRKLVVDSMHRNEDLKALKRVSRALFAAEEFSTKTDLMVQGLCGNKAQSVELNNLLNSVPDELVNRFNWREMVEKMVAMDDAKESEGLTGDPSLANGTREGNEPLSNTVGTVEKVMEYMVEQLEDGIDLVTTALDTSLTAETLEAEINAIDEQEAEVSNSPSCPSENAPWISNQVSHLTEPASPEIPFAVSPFGHPAVRNGPSVITHNPAHHPSEMTALPSLSNEVVGGGINGEEMHETPTESQTEGLSEELMAMMPEISPELLSALQNSDLATVVKTVYNRGEAFAVYMDEIEKYLTEMEQSCDARYGTHFASTPHLAEKDCAELQEKLYKKQADLRNLERLAFVVDIEPREKATKNRQMPGPLPIPAGFGSDSTEDKTTRKYKKSGKPRKPKDPSAPKRPRISKKAEKAVTVKVEEFSMSEEAEIKESDIKSPRSLEM